MQFHSKEISEHFERATRAVLSDPFESPETLGLIEVLRAHYTIADFFFLEGNNLGGIGPRNISLLESALGRAHVAFGGHPKWPTFLDKAATLFFGLIKDHPFHDANKRTALLSCLYLLSKQGLMPTCTKNKFEDFAVEIAEMGIANRARYRELAASGEDPEVKYISWWLRRNTRTIDRRDYTITMRDLRRILSRFGYELDFPKDNMIDILKIEEDSA